MKESNTIEATTDDIVNEFVNDDLMHKIGELLNEAKVSVGTVHFTMAYMIAVDIGERESDYRDLATGILSINQFIYSTVMAAFQAQRKAGAH